MSGENKIKLTSPLLVTASYDREKKIKVYGEEVAGFAKELIKEDGIELFNLLNFYDSQINSMALHKQWLAVAGFDCIKIFDVSSAAQMEIASYNHQDEQNNNRNTKSNRQQKLCKNAYRNETRVFFSSDGYSLFSCNERGIVTWWSFIMFKLTINQQINVLKVVSSIALHPNQQMLAIITKTGEIYFWTFNASCIPFPFIHIEDSLISADFSGDGNYLAVMNTKGSVWVWSDFTPKSHPMKKFNFIERVDRFQKTQYALKLKFSPDSKMLTIIGSDGMINVYDVLYDFVSLFEHVVKKPRENHHSHRSTRNPWIWDVEYSNDSQYLYFGASDGYARKWKIGEENYELIFHTPPSTKAISAIALYEGEV